MLAVAVIAEAAPVVSTDPKLAMLVGLVCAKSTVACSGTVICSAAFLRGSLSFVGAGLVDALLMPPPPISACTASTAGFGLVCLPSTLCFRLFASAIAAAPVKGAGDWFAEYLELIDFGDNSAVVNVCADLGCNKWGFSAPGARRSERVGSDVGVRGVSSAGNCSVDGEAARCVAAMGYASIYGAMCW